MKQALLTVTDVKTFISDAMQFDKVMTRDEISEYFGLAPQRISDYVKKGMPCFKINYKSKGFYLEDVRRWLISHGKIDG
jgi:phage terminase Nu1 subunit (DNA packaging protein)